ncbi:Jacalin-related lectin 3 [Striga hermonthica]|uniref:Jacalin-related lectin 3 n=1 Tax=Striga hermonthica TaxID=68872 RepID=A0A9N7R3I5_STRHE|nr:Jacalin-related lectin 3 [Striga hermonthica]
MFKGHADATAKRFGGKGGDKTEFLDIDYPNELVTGISGTVGHYGSSGNVVTSLEIITNRCKYGPFGKQAGTHFSFHAENGVIIGFHGRADSFMNAIGVYLRKVSVKKEPEVKVSVKKESKVIKLPIPVPRSSGPWGNVEGGKPWDDGVFSKVKEVHLYLCVLKNIICGVQFIYERRDGCDVLSPLHGGGLSVGRVEKLKLNEDDFVVGVEGFYGPIEGVDAIKSLKFYTKKRGWGPFGMEVGKYFNSIMGSNGVVVGFCGSSGGTYLSAIGVHKEYF